MTTTRAIEWKAQQVCGHCGEGVFTQVGPLALPLCSYCDHEHALDDTQLGADERFEWIGLDTATEAPTLHVVAYSPEEGE